MKELLEAASWIVAALSLIVNVIQLIKGNDLKKQLVNAKQQLTNSTANQQTHSGTGSNINAGRDVTF